MAGIPAAHAIVTIVPCSGAALVAAINTAAPGATLNLTPGCTYVLNNSTGPLPPINTPLTIHGRNSTIQRASGSSPFRLFTVNSNFNLDRVRLMGGDASTSPSPAASAASTEPSST